MPLSTPDQCQRHAEVCERIAALANDPGTRRVWLRLAERWRALIGDEPKGRGSVRARHLEVSRPRRTQPQMLSQ